MSLFRAMCIAIDVATLPAAQVKRMYGKPLCDACDKQAATHFFEHVAQCCDCLGHDALCPKRARHAGPRSAP